MYTLYVCTNKNYHIILYVLGLQIFKLCCVEHKYIIFYLDKDLKIYLLLKIKNMKNQLDFFHC